MPTALSVEFGSWAFRAPGRLNGVVAGPQQDGTLSSGTHSCNLSSRKFRVSQALRGAAVLASGPAQCFARLVLWISRIMPAKDESYRL